MHLFDLFEDNATEGKILHPNRINLYLNLRKPNAKPIVVGRNIPYKAMDAVIQKIVDKYSNVEADMFEFRPAGSLREDSGENDLYAAYDKILIDLCDGIVKHQKQNSDRYGLVAAAVVDPDHNVVYGINHKLASGKRVHAERAAMANYIKRHGVIPKNSIIITTLSPCTDDMPDRKGPSCTELLNGSPITRVYAGYRDPSQTHLSHDEFDVVYTQNSKIESVCKQIADCFLKESAYTDPANYRSEGVAEGLSESRNSLFAFVKQQFPTWPDYVLKDFLYQQAKGIRDQAELDDFLKRNKQDFGNCKWTLTKIPITLDIFTPKTQRMIQSREGGSSNPFQVPRDAERHAQQSQMIQQKGVSAEPIIVAKLSNGYDLIEGWHRTIQHLKAFPQGYTGPAWVCTGATYKSESVEQGVAEAFDNPYKTKTEKSEYGDIDMLAKLPDGTNLSIMFNNQGDDEWQVEFYRNNSQEVTGEGDAQRVFATVLASMQKFIKKYKPWRLTFSATKLLDPSTYYEPDQPVPNPESRAKLYNRLVQRYATAWGYEEYAEDHGDQITYELTRLKPGMAEGQENFNGIDISMEIQKDDEYVDDEDYDNQVLYVTASSKGKELGHVLFAFDGEYLMPQDLEVEERYRGQGIAQTMYDYVKSKGYKIRRSGQQTSAGAGFWDKHKGQGQNVWEQGVAENFADGRNPGRKGLAKRSGVNTKASVSSLRKTARHSTGEKARMAHWLANMKAGRAKKK